MNSPLWFSNLLFWSAQVALVVLVAGFLPAIFQIRQPRGLLVYWRTLLGLSLALPFVQPWHRPQIPSPIIISSEIPVSAIPASSPLVTNWHFPGIQMIAQIIGLVILMGIAVRFTLLALGLLKLRQFRKASSSISSSLEPPAVLEAMRALVDARAEFRISPDVDSPVTFGFAAPVILLPERFFSIDLRFQSAIACHELLHVRRNHWAHHLYEEILRAVFWFHPAIGWLIARVRLAREQVVDLDVVRLTQARKPYLEALLEFTSGRAHTTAVPAPPFLAERQLAERVALMLKEVSMSRRRLLASLTASSICIVMAATLAAWSLPLKAAPRAGQNPPQNGVTGGVSGGVTGGVSGGISGGISSGSASTDVPTVGKDTIWTDTVKRGPMVRQVRALGTLVRSDSGNLIARITLPELMVKEVQPSQNLTLATQEWSVKGHIRGLHKEFSGGVATLDIGLEDVTLPQGASAGLQIDATIDIEKLDNVLYIHRPVHAGVGATGNSTFSIFKIIDDGAEAVSVNVNFGRASVNTIEVLDGLKEGDKVILSDMSAYDSADRIRLK